VTDTPEDLSEYVRKVHENTQKYLRDLLAENEKLCDLVYTLERELDRQRKDRLHLEERLAAMESERRAYLERYLSVEEQNANVSSLYVAMLRIHGSIDHADVLSAIHEIVVNLVGSEELGVFETNAEGTALVLSSSVGIDASSLTRIPFGAGIIGGCAVTGKTHVVKDSAAALEPLDFETNITACVPLVVEGAVTGVVAIFRLLRHKTKLEPIDHELFALLGTHGASALYCTSLVEATGGRRSLHARAASMPPPPR
jgi:putative methionine-R-sulfoxide reductase with GAF domain